MVPSERKRKANNALGVGVLSLLALMETVFAHRRSPSPASPYVWSVLAATAVASLFYWLRYRTKRSGSGQ
jgi:hypothetical protein